MPNNDEHQQHILNAAAAARAQMEQIKAEKDTKQMIRNGAANENR